MHGIRTRTKNNKKKVRQVLRKSDTIEFKYFIILHIFVPKAEEVSLERIAK
jgi:hypothetical protein